MLVGWEIRSAQSLEGTDDMDDDDSAAMVSMLPEVLKAKGTTARGGREARSERLCRGGGGPESWF